MTVSEDFLQTYTIRKKAHIFNTIIFNLYLEWMKNERKEIIQVYSQR